MPSFETLLFLALGLMTAAGTYALVVALSRGGAGEVSAAVGSGDFAGALELAEGSPTLASRSERLAAAAAAKHLLRLEEAAVFLAPLLQEDPDDHEALLESGLVAAYSGRPEQAAELFARAAGRPDLAEPLTLHRAWNHLDYGDAPTALRLFEEIEAPFENKLRTDLGTGDPEFAEWFLQAAALWRAAGRREKAEWAAGAAVTAAPHSRLTERIYPSLPSGDTFISEL